MRITNGTMVNNMLKNLQNNMGNQDNLNQKLASGKQFQSPSDAPIKVTNSMQLKSLIENNEQYKRNAENSRNWLTSTESGLKNSGEILQRARELAVYGANGSQTNEDREAIAIELEQLKEELINIGNSKLGDRYLFAGQATASEPFDNAGVYQGDYNTIQWQTNPSTRITVSVNGDEAFTDAIETLQDLKDHLDTGDIAAMNDDIGDLDTAINNNTRIRADVGAKMNRLDLMDSRLDDEILNLQNLLSKNEDIDIAETITDMKMQESVYRSALSVGAKIIQPSLVDFIR